MFNKKMTKKMELVMPLQVAYRLSFKEIHHNFKQ